MLIIRVKELKNLFDHVNIVFQNNDCLRIKSESIESIYLGEIYRTYSYNNILSVVSESEIEKTKDFELVLLSNFNELSELKTNTHWKYKNPLERIINTYDIAYLEFVSDEIVIRTIYVSWGMDRQINPFQVVSIDSDGEIIVRVKESGIE